MIRVFLGLLLALVFSSTANAQCVVGCCQPQCVQPQLYQPITTLNQSWLFPRLYRANTTFYPVMMAPQPAAPAPAPPQPRQAEPQPQRIPLELDIIPRVQLQQSQGKYRELIIRDAGGSPYLIRGYQK